MSCPLPHCPSHQAPGAVSDGGPPPIFREVMADLAGKPPRATTGSSAGYTSRPARRRFTDDDHDIGARDPWQRVLNR
jgi:hypothetical protein